MDGIFTLPYSEFEIVNKFQESFKRKDGFSVYIPVSRQEKAVDFILSKNKSHKIARFQVKSSRTYIHEAEIKKNGVIKNPEYKYNLWFNNFIEKYEQGSADYYLLFGLYPIYTNDSSIDSNFWKSMIVCLSDEKMNETLKNVLTKREKKSDRFYGLSFNHPNQIVGTRGFLNNPDFSEYILEKQIENIVKYFA
jgi:hypothetical protein